MEKTKLKCITCSRGVEYREGCYFGRDLILDNFYNTIC